MNESVRREECSNTASLAFAYLSARRRQPAGPLLLNVVRNVNGQAVDFGSPSEWGPGIAWSVIRGELWVDVLEFNANFVDLEAPDELEQPCRISRSISHPCDLFRRPSLNLVVRSPAMASALASLVPADLALAIHVPELTTSPPPRPSLTPPLSSPFKPLLRSRSDPLSPPSKSRSATNIFALPSPRTRKVCTLLPGLTHADIAFVESLDVGVVGEKGQRTAMEDYYICVPDFDKIVKEKLQSLQEGSDPLDLSRGLSGPCSISPAPTPSDATVKATHLSIAQKQADLIKTSANISSSPPPTVSIYSQNSLAHNPPLSSSTCSFPSSPSAPSLPFSPSIPSACSFSSSSSTVTSSACLSPVLLAEELRCAPNCSVCPPGFAYFAVFDGHGGQGCAAYCSQSIHKDIAIRFASALTTLPNDDVLCDAILSGFLDAERVWLGLALNREVGIEKSGSTAALVLFHGQRMYVAHCGDTRVVLSRKGTAMDLTKDHTCKNLAEAERVERDGGRVIYGAVNGTIEVTRSIGDYEDSGRKTPGLTAVPEISKFVLTAEDEFIIIACDGLWDVMNSEQAVGYARISLREDNDIQKACADLVQKALHTSEDNVTVLMVGFTKPGTGSSGPFIVDKVCPSFNKKAFQCDRCSHLFEGRNKLEQCPYCAGRKLCGQIECKHCFVRSFASFEDKTKIRCWVNGNNEEREALLVSMTSKEKFWFQCNLCPHRFEACLSDVTSASCNAWCPYCSGSARCSDAQCSYCVAPAKKPATQSKSAYVPPHRRGTPSNGEDVKKEPIPGAESSGSISPGPLSFHI